MKWKIKDIKIDNQVALAPMAGVSNPSYMKICEEMGCGYAITELISAEAIVRDNKKTFDMLKGYEDLKMPVGIQIFGSNEETMAKAAKIVENTNLFKFIDINCGCPVPKVAIKSKAGSALLKDPNKIFEIVNKVVSEVNIPVTIKIRSGWDEKHINAVEVAKLAEKAGAAAIAIHARTRSQGYSGNANWDIIKDVKNAVNIPVIGNGDIKTAEDAKKMLEETGCDAVMIGRAALGNPWFIKECVEYIENSKIIDKPTDKEKIEMIRKHYGLLKKYTSEKQALLEIRTHALWYLKGINGVKEFKNELMQTKNEKEFFKEIDKINEFLESSN